MSPKAFCEVLLVRGFSPNSYLNPVTFTCNWPLRASASAAGSDESAAGNDDSTAGSDNSAAGRDDNRETALHCAVLNDSPDKVKLLLAHSADLTPKWRGMTALELAIAYNAGAEILALLS